MPESYKEDARPSQQWYWNDWFSAFDVRNCCLAARGLWIDILGIMWKAEIRGTLTVNGKQPDNKTLAKIVGGSVSEVRPLLKELETNNVFSRLNDGTIICRRMFRESLKKEDISKIRSKAGKEGAKKRWQPDGKLMAKHGKNNLPLANGNGKPMAKITGVGDGKPIIEKMAKMAASISSSPSSSPSSANKRKEMYKEKEMDLTKKMLQFFEQEFERYWDNYDPRGKKNKQYAKKRFMALCKQGKLEEFDKGYTGYANYLKDKRINEGFDQKPKYFSTLISDYEEYIGHEYRPPM